MTESEKTIYEKIARLLYKEAERVDSADVEAVGLIEDIAHLLIPFDKAYEEKHDLGVMHEIDEWMGLKLDAPEMAKKYGLDIKQGYSRILEE